MPSDFDNAFAKIKAQSDAEARAKHSQALSAQQYQLLVRSIAEPPLRQLGSEVRQKLHELKVPLQQQTVPRSGWFKTKRRFWTLETRNGSGLYLTEDGYFVTDWKLSGPEGFDAMMEKISLTSAPEYLVESGIHVDDKSRKLIYVYGTRGNDGPAEVVPLADLLARQVVGWAESLRHHRP